MLLLYSFLLTIGFLILLPRFLFQKKYAASFRERLGHLADFDAQGKPVVWLHCVSVGEAQAARPLVKELKENFPEYNLVISTTTLTGQNLAKEIFADEVSLIFCFPFDFRFSVRRVLRKIKPKIVLLMETEIWFNFIREAGKSGAKVIMVNGRISEKSAKHYAWIPKTMRRVFQSVDLALTQTSADAKRLVKIGIHNSKVRITGNLKFDQDFDETESELTKGFRERFAISKDNPLIVAASTHAPEERLILNAFKIARETATKHSPRLMIAPRHPERFDEVTKEIKKENFNFARRSSDVVEENKLIDVILLDSIGELRAVFPLAEIVFVGGSLIPHGGQNILEPAAARKAIVTGFYTMNFKAIVDEFLEKKAIIQLPKLDESEIPAKLASVFNELLQNEKKRDELAANAFDVVKKNRGATAKTIDYLKSIFEAQSAASKIRELIPARIVSSKP